MSTALLNNLLEYLYGTLSPSNMRWVAGHLIEHAKKVEEASLKPYTMDEINARIDQAERDSAEGRFRPIEDVFQEWGMEYAAEETSKVETA
ncbi:MAG: hypothetical protein IJU81_06040 [Bacteroidales bacterium]|nr:hypothetical protein [Bacteroidales bacterium]